MIWRVVLGRSAAKAFKKVQKQDRERLLAALEEMGEKPLEGDLVSLRGKAKGAYRRRVGDWRILFDVNWDGRRIEVTDIRRRSSTTY